MTQWAERRARVGHELVVNRLILRLSGIERAMSGQIQTNEDLSIGLLELWNIIREEVADLNGTVLEEMSPRILFREPPLCYCTGQTKAWLIPFVCDRWMYFWAVEERMTELHEAARVADCCISLVLECLRNAQRGKESFQALTDAREAAHRLAGAIAAMPRSVLA